MQDHFEYRRIDPAEDNIFMICVLYERKEIFASLLIMKNE